MLLTIRLWLPPEPGVLVALENNSHLFLAVFSWNQTAATFMEPYSSSEDTLLSKVLGKYLALPFPSPLELNYSELFQNFAVTLIAIMQGAVAPSGRLPILGDILGCYNWEDAAGS